MSLGQWGRAGAKARARRKVRDGNDVAEKVQKKTKKVQDSQEEETPKGPVGKRICSASGDGGRATQRQVRSTVDGQ